MNYLLYLYSLSNEYIFIFSVNDDINKIYNNIVSELEKNINKNISIYQIYGIINDNIISIIDIINHINNNIQNHIYHYKYDFNIIIKTPNENESCKNCSCYIVKDSYIPLINRCYLCCIGINNSICIRCMVIINNQKKIDIVNFINDHKFTDYYCKESNYICKLCIKENNLFLA